LEKYGNLILADGILWRLNYFTSVRSRLTSAYNNNNNNNNNIPWPGQAAVSDPLISLLNVCR